MATTTNFGWETPDDTDLVKDGAAAIRTLGSAIDTSLVDLKGGTTGQVLSKASNTDMDFSWIAVDPLTILDAKGDLISATAADTPARLAVGTNGQVLTADSTTSTGLKWATATSGWTEIASGSLSSTSVVINSIPSTYKNLQLIISDLSYASAYDIPKLRANGNTGSVYLTQGIWSSTGATTPTSFRDSTSYWLLVKDGGGSVAASDTEIVVNIYDYANSTSRKVGTIQSYIDDESYSPARVEYMGADIGFNSTSAISSLTIFSSTNSFDGGTYKLLGL